MLERKKILEIIGDLYSEQEQENMPDESVKFSISMEGSDLAFFDSVAQHFDCTRTRLLSGVLEEAIMATLLSLSVPDRLAVLKKANENTKIFWDNLHKDTANYQRVGETKWLAWHDSLINEESKKDA